MSLVTSSLHSLMSGLSLLRAPVLHLLVLSSLMTACGSSGSKKAAESVPGTGPSKPAPSAERPFRATLASFSVQPGAVNYALGNSLRELSSESDENEKYYCSINGSAFERCQQRGAIPLSRLRPGLNVFQVEVSINGVQSGHVLYHEFAYGLPPANGQ